MSARLNPYLTFPGTAREAMQLYERVCGGTLTLMTFADAGAEGVPDPQQVMHAMLETPSGFTLMASDLPPGAEHQMWGDEFGACTDRFGVHWMVNIAGDSVRG
jgi:PhnB protein